MRGNEYLGFVDKEDQVRWQAASKYDDCWAKKIGKKGQLLGRVTSYHICMSGSAQEPTHGCRCRSLVLDHMR